MVNILHSACISPHSQQVSNIGVTICIRNKRDWQADAFMSSTEKTNGLTRIAFDCKFIQIISDADTKVFNTNVQQKTLIQNSL
jgi:hypothetical protein